VEHVHFHEIGAVDTIIDVLGAALCIEYLKADTVVFSALATGHGTVNTEHGVMPVPAPATAEMMKGFQTRALPVEGETLTPTGCAILTALGVQRSPAFGGAVAGIGYGAGTKSLPGFPNMLRAMLLDESATGIQGDMVAVLESDIDHISGEIMAFAAEVLMEQGALDVSWCPVFMKKGRPGYRLTVVCVPIDEPKMIECLMKQTRTLGVRRQLTARSIASREPAKSTFMDVTVEEKICDIGGTKFTKIEYESLAAVARQSGKPIVELAEEYVRAIRRKE
jgi:uncharacterized protein (TIGR00299 family) protein